MAAAGTRVNAFASGLDHPRYLYVLPNGDVLVAETNAPPKPDDQTGFRGKMFKHFQKKAGAGVPSANRITLLRDADGDGAAETRTVFLSGLHSPPLPQIIRFGRPAMIIRPVADVVVLLTIRRGAPRLARRYHLAVRQLGAPT